MTRKDLYDRLDKGPLILDGATGSNLQKAGMPPGVCPELWILDHPDVLVSLQEAYVRAGSDILYAPTFSGNRIKLSEYGIGDQVRQINRELVKLSKKAAGGKALVAGDMTMTGKALAPLGPLTMVELVDIYKEQAMALLAADVDLFVIETMMSLAETRAALIAIRELTDLPVIASMTFGEDGRSLYGTDPVTALVVLQSLSADVVGINCSTGPAEMAEQIRIMKDYASVPLLAKPNAGLPVLIGGKTVYNMGPEEFASYGPALLEAGASLVGGCCGTTPEHMEKLCQSLKGLPVRPPKNLHPRMLASERQSLEICPDKGFLVIGERINPTGKKALSEELRRGRLDLVEEYAMEQEKMGAHILDVNMGTNGIDEKEMMLAAIERITMVTGLPLCIDSSYVEVMEAALLHYPGRALINSISLEEDKIDALLPLARKYGAMFILLPLSKKGLPESLSEKKEIILEIIKRAEALGIAREDIIVDGLVTTVGANKNAALETLETIRWCRESLDVATTVGLSNISFGLPQRPYVNSAFAAMAISAGLTMAIANPSNSLLMGIAYAADLLRNREGADTTYIDQIQRIKDQEKEKAYLQASRKREASLDNSPGQAPDQSSDKKNEAGPSPFDQAFPGASMEASAVFGAVLKGKQKSILSLIDSLFLADPSAKAGQILDHILIPAINEVGRLFDRQIYFLPQLISSANTMEEAVRYLEPRMKMDQTGRSLPTIVIATVEGDIHDIGKNLVALMFRNYGYQVIDLGKDVPAEKIIEAARNHKASLITLSALMTTTMMRMKDTILLRDQELPDTRVIIGGAVTTQEFADEIGADGYSKDAADAVRLVKRLLASGEIE